MQAGIGMYRIEEEEAHIDSTFITRQTVGVMVYINTYYQHVCWYTYNLDGFSTYMDVGQKPGEHKNLFSRWTCITKMIHSHIANYSPKLVYKPSDLKSAVEISTQNHKNHSHNIPKVVNLYPSLPETLHHITTGKSIRPFKLRHSQLVPGKSCWTNKRSGGQGGWSISYGFSARKSPVVNCHIGGD